MASSVIRRGGVLLAGGGVYATAVYLTYHYLRMNKEQNLVSADGDNYISYVNNPDRTKKFQKVAEFYDEFIGRDEIFMGINLLRRSLLFFHAKGTVLEVGAGTGRNISFYPSSVDRVVLTDSSDQMLLQAKNKIQRLTVDERKRFAVIEADSARLSLPENAFDTVVDTFGLCSYDDPVLVLKEMARVCKPSGKILLLEHGRSKTWDFVTDHLDKHAEQHAANWGCVWNRDLDAVIAASGLDRKSVV